MQDETKQVLTDEQIDDMAKEYLHQYRLCAALPEDSIQDFARDIESAILAKLNPDPDKITHTDVHGRVWEMDGQGTWYIDGYSVAISFSGWRIYDVDKSRFGKPKHTAQVAMNAAGKGE
jgi:hypothetical protein